MRKITEKRKQYLKNYQRNWIAKRRFDYFKDKECIICGSKERLELDHIDPALKETHNIWSWSKARREVELVKCQVLCSICHLAKTKEYLKKINTKPISHGTYMGYQHKKCRCPDCKLFYKNYRHEKYMRIGC